MRVASIDIGTNSVLLLVADVLADGSLAAIEEVATITRLGEGVDRTRALLPAAITRTVACLDAYAQRILHHRADRVGIVGTSAMRDADGADVLRAQIWHRFRVEPRILSGEEEARLTFAGALSGLARSTVDAVVFDIGGGSTEVVRGRANSAGAVLGLDLAQSFDVGAVRLTERHLRADPPSDEELAALLADARTELEPLRALAPVEEPVGIAGTVTTLASIALGLPRYDAARVHGHWLTVDDVRALRRRLQALPLAERRAVVGLEPNRADVIVAGALLLETVLELLGAPGLRVSDRGVRWGLAGELAMR